MKTRAKVVVDSVKVTEYADIVEFRGVCGDTPEDNSFAAATPQAKFEMTVNNKAVRGQFRPGQKYYVDFTPVE